jgi:phage N-6-adenine-methyltransferase
MQNSLFNVVSENMTTNDYYTPKWLFDQMDLEFDIDVAAPKQGIPWIPAKAWFSQENDGLAQNWGGKLVWMNPPFSNTTPWVHKFMENNNGMALLVVSRSKWFAELWDRADAIMATPADLKFERPDGNAKAISFQTFLFAMGEPSVNALHKTKLAKVR